MRILLIIIFNIIIFQPVAAQSDKSFRENSINPDSNNPVHSIFRYQQFQKGAVSLTNHPLVWATLNYNYLSGQLLFINQKGDTLELAQPESLQYIAIGTDTFHYADNGYVEMLTHYPAINLYKKQLIKFNGKEKKGAYGTYSGTSASSSIDTYSNETINEKIGIDENTLYATLRRYYISDRFNHFLSATKKNFFKLFSSKEKILADYLNTNPVHYGNESELRKLIEYLQSN